MAKRPNVLIILADDLGYSDLGCYGGEIRTPVIDKLAKRGVRLSNFHNTPRCTPSRASLLTGLHPHTAGIGVLTNSDAPRGYPNTLDPRVITLADILGEAGYTTAIRGKWHLSSDMANPNPSWPTFRGFQSFWGTLAGAGSFYEPTRLTRGTENAMADALDPDFFYTDRIAEESIAFLDEHAAGEDAEQPFFLYMPFTAPHWPLHAREETIAHYKGRFDAGWDTLRAERLERLKASGLLPEDTELSPRDPGVIAWEDEPEKEWQARRMEVYAAQVEEMDTAIGRVLSKIEELGAVDDTIVIFLSDNGASSDPVPLVPELNRFRRRSDVFNNKTRAGETVRLGNDPTIIPGPEDTFASYGKEWANLSNTPFRLYKEYAHEGGVAAPFIMSWPNGGITPGSMVDEPRQLVHVLPTILEATETTHPAITGTADAPKPEGTSMLGVLRGEDGGEPPVLWWEHIGNCGIQSGKWKAVQQYTWEWELYDISVDRVEIHDVAADHPDVLEGLVEEWQRTADRVGVIPFKETMRLYHEKGLGWREASGG